MPPPSTNADHARFMRVALGLARRRLGQVWPNPAVGALVVKDGQIVAAAATAKGGRPHAETQALTAAGERARGAALYVTLEPCSHHGKTPPCIDAIIHSGIETVIVACQDKHPLVSGQGIAALKAAGIAVIESVGEAEALDINRGFFSVIEKNRPYVALKIATSLDGKVTMPGQRWLTGEHARAYGHLLRAQYDAIATGIGTVLADDPPLTCRLPGLEDRSPVRVVFDRNARLPANSQLMKTAKDVPLWLFTSPSPLEGEGRDGGSIEGTSNIDGPPSLTLPLKGGGNEIAEALRTLADKGITRLLLEAGPALSAAFLQAGVVDRIYWFRAPMLVGDAGLAMDTSALALTREDTLTLGQDRLELYRLT